MKLGKFDGYRFGDIFNKIIKPVRESIYYSQKTLKQNKLELYKIMFMKRTKKPTNQL